MSYCMLPEDIQAKVEDKVKESVDLIELQVDVVMPEIQIRYDLRGKNGGQAGLEGGIYFIRINPYLLLDHEEEYLAQTVPHEVAHIGCFKRFPGQKIGHGPEWQTMMRLLGLDPKRCHRYDTSNAQVKRMSYFEYRCDCRTHKISKVRHNKVQRGTQTYSCRGCSGELIFIGAWTG